MKIIIWGAGNWGEQVYWHYKNDQIIFYVDSDEEKVGRKVPWANVAVNRIKEINNYKDTKIVIAVNRQGEIKEVLQGMGVSEDRIISCKYEDVVEYSEFSYLPLIDSSNDNQLLLNRYLYEAYLWRKNSAKEAFEYYPTLVNILKRKDAKYCIEMLKDSLLEISYLEVRIIALRLMYEYNCFDSECMQIFIKSLLSIPIKDDTIYGLAMDTTYMVHKHFNYVYNEFYTQRRMLLEKLSKKYELNTNEITRVCTSKKKLAMLCHCDLYFEKNNAARESIVASYANAMNKLGVEVHIFILCNIYRTEDENVFLRELVCTGEYDEAVRLRLEKYLDHRITLHRYYDTNIKRRLQKSINDIISYNPSYILDMSDECALQPFVLYKIYPIVYFPMRRHMTSSFFDVYLTGSKKVTIEENNKYKSVPPMKMYEISLGSLPEIRDELIEIKREDNGFSEKDFLIVTVGSRLRYEITDDIIYAMVGLLRKYKYIKWILVGDEVHSDLKEFVQMVAQNKIILWGYENSIVSLYRICNAYFQPDRPGGALSIRQAMREGLPIIMSDYPSDQKGFMDSCDLIIGGIDNLIGYAEKLYCDKEFYLQTSRRMKNKVMKYSSYKDAEKILHVLEMIGEEKRISTNNYSFRTKLD